MSDSVGAEWNIQVKQVKSNIVCASISECVVILHMYIHINMEIWSNNKKT